MTPEQIREARIRLAEWMGWKRVPHDNGFGVLHYWTHSKTIMPDRADCPDPFTDANDDYAVLGWMRENLPDESVDGYSFSRWELALEEMQDDVSNPYCESWAQYRIGDYARAALKVIDNDT